MDNTNKQLQGKIASLESKVDMLEAELFYLDEMLVRCGFPQGIKTLKETVQEVLAEDALQAREKQELI
jgi:hypothetical protein